MDGGQPRELCRFTKNGKVDARTVCNIDLDPACMDKLVWKSFWENEPAPDDSQAMASGSSDSAAATPVPAGEPGAPALWLGPGPSPARQVRMAPLTRQCYRHRFFVARSELLATCLLGYSLVRVRFHYCYLLVAMASAVSYTHLTLPTIYSV